MVYCYKLFLLWDAQREDINRSGNTQRSRLALATAPSPTVFSKISGLYGLLPASLGGQRQLSSSQCTAPRAAVKITKVHVPFLFLLDGRIVLSLKWH